MTLWACEECGGDYDDDIEGSEGLCDECFAAESETGPLTERTTT